MLNEERLATTEHVIYFLLADIETLDYYDPHGADGGRPARAIARLAHGAKPPRSSLSAAP